MAEKLKDAEDRFLEAVFRAEPIADDGFSQRIVSRIRRRLWLRRLALPVAMLAGGAIAIKPASELFLAASTLLTAAPPEMVRASIDWLPQLQGVAISGSVLQIVVFSVILLGAGLFGSRMLAE